MTPIFFAANVVVLGVGVAVGFTRGRLYTAFFGALLVLQLSSLLLLESDSILYGPSIVAYGQALVLLGNATVVGLAVATERFDLAPPTNRQTMALEARVIPRYLIIVIVLLTVAFATRFRSGVSGGLATWQEARSGTGALDALANVLAFFAVPAPIVLWWSKRRMAALVLTPFVLVYLQLAGSRAMALTIPSFLLLALIRTPESTRRKLKSVALLGLIAMVGYAGFRTVRNVPISELPARFGEAITTSGNDVSGGESRMLGSFYYLLAAGRDDHPYGDGVTAQRLATIYAQRGDRLPKPDDVTYEIWSDYVDDGYVNHYSSYELIRDLADAGTPGSDHPTVWGDAYANFGSLGIPIYGLVLGGLVVFLDLVTMRLSTVARALILPVAAVTYQGLARGSVVISVGYVAYGIPVILLLLAALRLPIRARSARRHNEVPSTLAVAAA